MDSWDDTGSLSDILAEAKGYQRGIDDCIKEIEKLFMEQSKDESNSDWFYALGNNHALIELGAKLEALRGGDGRLS